jgi:hypothetical protein
MSLESASQAQSALTRKDRMQQCYMTCGRRNNKIAAAKRRCWKSRGRNSCRGRFEGRSYNRFRSRHSSGSWALINLPAPDLSSTLNSINPIQATARNGRPHFCPSWNAVRLPHPTSRWGHLNQARKDPAMRVHLCCSIGAYCGLVLRLRYGCVGS